MDPYEGVPAVHDNELIALRIVRTPDSATVVLEMRKHLSSKPINVSFPDIAWVSANVLGNLVFEEPTVIGIQRIPMDWVPTQYTYNGGFAFEITLSAGSVIRLISGQPEVS
jgi:hypothetical protein